MSLANSKVLRPEGICTISILTTYLNVPVSQNNLQIRGFDNECCFSGPVITQSTLDRTLDLKGFISVAL